jgi:hypothetical protein
LKIKTSAPDLGFAQGPYGLKMALLVTVSSKRFCLLFFNYFLQEHEVIISEQILEYFAQNNKFLVIAAY